MEQTDPRLRRNSARLAFAHHMDRFVTRQGAPSTPERPEMLRAWIINLNDCSQGTTPPVFVGTALSQHVDELRSDRSG